MKTPHTSRMTFGRLLSLVCVLVVQSSLTLCDPIDCSPPGFSVHGIFQARKLSMFPFPTPGDLPDTGPEPTSLMSPALAGSFTCVSLPLCHLGSCMNHQGSPCAGLRPTLFQYDLILTHILITSARMLFLYEVTFTSTRG